MKNDITIEEITKILIDLSFNNSNPAFKFRSEKTRYNFIVKYIHNGKEFFNNKRLLKELLNFLYQRRLKAAVRSKTLRIWDKVYGKDSRIGKQIHHIDEDPFNNDISNLEDLTPKEHQRKTPFNGVGICVGGGKVKSFCFNCDSELLVCKSDKRYKYCPKCNNFLFIKHFFVKGFIQKHNKHNILSEYEQQ